MNFNTDAEKYEHKIIGYRRHLHAHPELSFEEKETTAFIESQLRNIGLIPRCFKDYYGLWVDIRGSAEPENRKTVVLRADIDALPIQEETGLPFSSVNDGVMHACGHDSHTAMLLGAAHILSDHLNELPGTVRLLFQSAEESCHGAKYYVEHGLLDDAGAVFGMHVWGTLDTPYFNIDDGARMSSCDNFTITVKGAASHGSAPNYGIDAITAAAAIIMQLQTIVSRRNDPRDPLAVTIGEITGGRRFNIIADQVVMKGTARTHNPKVRKQLEGWIRNVAENTARAAGAEAALAYEYFPDVLMNDPSLSKLARNSAVTLYGKEALGAHPSVMGSEDFSYFLDKVPGAFAFIGTRNPQKGLTAQNHSPYFDTDEDILKKGAALYAQFAYDYLTDKEEKNEE